MKRYGPVKIGQKVIEESNQVRGVKIDGKINIENDRLKEVNRLDVSTFPKHPSILLVSQRRAGKSTALRSILYEHGHQYDEVYIISQTAKFNNDYYFVKPEHIFNAENIDKVISMILSMAEEDILKKKKVNRLIILDDVMGFVRNSEEVSGLFTRGRHFYITVFLIVQRISAVRPEIRNNSDIIASALSKSKDVQEFFIDEFLSANFIKKEAYDIFKKVTNNPFHFIVAENHKQTIEPSEFIKYYYTDIEKPDLKIYKNDNVQKLTNKSIETGINNNSSMVNKTVKIKISDNNIDGTIRKRRGKTNADKGMGKKKGANSEFNLFVKKPIKRANLNPIN